MFSPFPTRLYIDVGTGFNESQILSKRVHRNVEEIQFSTQHFGKIRDVRFDPIDDYLVLHLKKVIIYASQNYLYETNDYSTNAIFNIDGRMIFTTDKPQIVVHIFNNTIKGIVFQVHYEAIGKETIQHIRNAYEESRLQDREKIFECIKDNDSNIEKTRALETDFIKNATRLQLLEDERVFLKRSLEAERQIHIGLLNSRSWKLMAPIRYLSLKCTIFRHYMKTIAYHLNREYIIIRKSGLFHDADYLKKNPDVESLGIFPISHYLSYGAKEGRSPHPLFDPDYYRLQNPDLAISEINPLVHYITVGAGQGKDPHPLFRTDFYLLHNPDVTDSGMNPLQHYLEIGSKEGRSPHPLFDPDYYRLQNPDLAISEINPLVHYIINGNFNKSNPHPLFHTAFYLNRYPEVTESKINALVHYVTKGAANGFNPNPLFDSIYYLRCNPDVDAAGVNPLAHYVQSGSVEGRDPNPLFDSVYYKMRIQDANKWNKTLLEHYQSKGWKSRKSPGPIFDPDFYLERYPEIVRSGMDALTHYLESGVFEGRSPNHFIERLTQKPKISILVPIYNVEERFLKETISSVKRQIYSNWELCLVDDCSDKKYIRRFLQEVSENSEKIKIKYLDANSGISNASNEAASMATGEYLALLDHDDVLTMDALYGVVKAIKEYDADIVYSDEGLIDIEGRYLDSIFKPNFSPDLLLSHNYITHFLVFKKTLFDEIGGFDSRCDGAQDYDLVLKLSEKTLKIHHISKVLYFWRKSASSTSLNPANKSYADDAGKRALENALIRKEIEGKVVKANLPFFYRVKREISGNPLISIIIPFKDYPEFLKNCIQTILHRTNYSNFEIIGINNGSKQEETFTLMKDLCAVDSRVGFFPFPAPFNYSKINNFGVSLASGEILLLLNNDVEILNSDWLEALLEHGQRDDVGAVGGKLYYPNQTIQHAGVIIGIAGFAGHSHRHVAKEAKGYANRLMCIQNVSAVSGAMLMVKKQIYVESGGLDEDNLRISLNDIDFCLKLRQKGYLNIFTPFCEAIHHESISRGYEQKPEQKLRFLKEIKYFQHKWKKILEDGDPYYNPNLTLEGEDFSLKRKPKG